VLAAPGRDSKSKRYLHTAGRHITLKITIGYQRLAGACALICYSVVLNLEALLEICACEIASLKILFRDGERLDKHALQRLDKHIFYEQS
jgi:hypothetical protein